MLIQLSKVISTQNYSKTVDGSIDMSEIKLKGVSYPIRKKEMFPITLKNVGGSVVSITLKTEITLGVPCDRCLEEVLFPVRLDVFEEIDFDHLDSAKEPVSFVEDKVLDVDILVFDEVVPALPSKLICKDDCKGLCPVCGTNLNKKECGCDRTVADPRMAAIQDIFKNFKEV